MSTSRPPLQALLIDLSGTLHVGSTPTTGSVEALTRLRDYNAMHKGSPLPFRFCSNTSKEGRRELEARLLGMGFDIRIEDEDSVNSPTDREMWTSLGALSGVLQAKGLKRPFCLLQKSAQREVLRDLDVHTGNGASFTGLRLS